MPVTSRQRLILLCGLPGAGKTTLAQRLESEVPAVRLCPDEWMVDLGIDLRNNDVRDRLEARLSRLAFTLLGHGQSVVLEYGFWGRSERDQKRAEAHAIGVPIDLYYLNPSPDELWRRLQERNERATHETVIISRAELDQYASLFQPPDAAECALFDHAATIVGIPESGDIHA